MLNNLLGDVGGNLLVTLKLHRVGGATLGRGPQIGRVTEHLSQRYESLDRKGVAALLLALNLATPPREVTDHIAEEVLGRNRLDRHHGLEENRVGLSGGMLDRHLTCDF